ncbi:hypothetical protein [Streptomyces sp. NPDC057428]|uniref:hypothetical protein n=1 Tax=Streptomyces sp. NPDC057428 TaxID=3346129 RepID=UPI0036A78EF5
MTSLTAEPPTAALGSTVGGVDVNGDTVTLRWDDDGVVTGVSFAPLEVKHREP